MAQNNTAEKVLEIAGNEVGATRGKKYVQYYNDITSIGLPLDCFWCACFVTWVMRQAAVPIESVFNYKGCAAAVNWFKAQGRWRTYNDGYTPMPGDVIIFEWYEDGIVDGDHTGIVEYVKNNKVYTIEGNAGNKGVCMRKNYSLSSNLILGYGIPQYNMGEIYKMDITESKLREIINEEIDKSKTVYKYFEDVPSWGQAAVKKYIQTGIMAGEGKDETGKTVYNISLDLLRTMVMFAKEK